VLTILFILPLCLVPPFSRDALTHHLAIPKLYLEHGGMYEIPYLKFSYYPMNLDLLYLIPIYFGNDILPKLMHFIFALFTAYLVFQYLAKRISLFYAATGTIFFLTTPIIIKLSITAYVDLGLVFFSTASIIYLLRWVENDFSLKYLIISAVMCGLALGTKYNGLITCFILVFLVTFLYLKLSTDGSLYKKTLSVTMMFLIISALLFSPWMIRNYHWTGNPIYPLYNGIFNPNSNESSGDDGTVNHFVFRSIIYKESFWDILLIPIRIFFQGKDNDPQFFDGKLNPLLLFLPFFAFTQKSKKSIIQVEKYVLILFSVMYLLIAFFERDMRIRYVSPIIPPLILLSMFGLRNILNLVDLKLSRYPKNILKSVILGIFMGFVSINYNYLLQQWQQLEPIKYISGEISKDDYLEKRLPEYSVIRFANENLNHKAVILSFFLGNRSYYSERNLLFDKNILFDHLKSKNPADYIQRVICGQGITHFLIRYDLFQKYAQENLGSYSKKILSVFIQERLSPIFSSGGFGLFEVKDCESEGIYE